MSKEVFRRGRCILLGSKSGKRAFWEFVLVVVFREGIIEFFVYYVVGVGKKVGFEVIDF